MERVAYIGDYNSLASEVFAKQDTEPRQCKENSEICGGGGKSLEGICKKVQSVLIDKKLYLQADVTLTALSQVLCTNTTYLSKVINSYYHCNLKTLLNRLRVEYAKELLRHERCNIMMLPRRCGFLSRSTFYAAFTKYEGMTPVDFRERYCTAPPRKKPSPLLVPPEPIAI